MNTYQLRFSCTATELYSGDATVRANSLEEAKGKLKEVLFKGGSDSEDGDVQYVYDRYGETCDDDSFKVDYIDEVEPEEDNQ